MSKKRKNNPQPGAGIKVTHPAYTGVGTVMRFLDKENAMVSWPQGTAVVARKSLQKVN
jgi:hypothetical protein